MLRVKRFLRLVLGMRPGSSFITLTKESCGLICILSLMTVVILVVWAVLGHALMLVLSPVAGVPYDFKENGHIGMILLLFSFYAAYGVIWFLRKWKESGQPID